jgi:hypothetical protein
MSLLERTRRDDEFVGVLISLRFSLLVIIMPEPEAS